MLDILILVLFSSLVLKDVVLLSLHFLILFYFLLLVTLVFVAAGGPFYAG